MACSELTRGSKKKFTRHWKIYAVSSSTEHMKSTGKAWGNKGNIREREESSYRTYNGTRKCIKKQGITVKTLAQGTKTIH